MASTYLDFAASLLGGALDASIKAALVTSDFVPDYLDTATYAADVSGFEISGGDYVAGGKVVVATVETDVEVGLAYLDAPDLTWTGLDAADVGGIVFYYPGSGVLIAADMYAAALDASGGTSFTHTMPAGGLVSLSIPA